MKSPIPISLDNNHVFDAINLNRGKERIGYVWERSYAEYIANAVNAHEELLGTLKAVDKLVLKNGKHQYDKKAIIEMVSVAIKKAQGGV